MVPSLHADQCRSILPKRLAFMPCPALPCQPVSAIFVRVHGKTKGLHTEVIRFQELIDQSLRFVRRLPRSGLGAHHGNSTLDRPAHFGPRLGASFKTGSASCKAPTRKKRTSSHGNLQNSIPSVLSLSRCCGQASLIHSWGELPQHKSAGPVHRPFKVLVLQALGGSAGHVLCLVGLMDLARRLPGA